MTDSPSFVVVGAGRMGRGIALAYALRGHPIVLVDLKPRSVEERDRLDADIQRELRGNQGRLSQLGLVVPDRAEGEGPGVSIVHSEDAAGVLTRAELVYEAVPETEAAKRDALDAIGRHARPDTLIASTTSTMLASELASMVGRPERFLNAHWLNPAFVVPLVEISAHPGTSDEAVAWLRGHLVSIGKVPVVCGPHPGYIVPRLQALIMNEAARMVDEGVASAEDIDRATRYGLGFRFANMGVLEFVDYGGNDILYQASEYLARTVDPYRYEVPEIVSRFMESGRNGLRDGRGFHEYPPDMQDAYRADVLARLVGMSRHLGLISTPIDGGADGDVPV
ncbi:MAG: 3-hydroxyacyl-CoA dehydrogenase NAD-binding domain-containing protein [Nocardioidaceae bacterium]|nr:3-hydroxyacyl-CoA dehydrogenase NAD-binding domain-containing protein [Nocardioidaceae bacterium]